MSRLSTRLAAAALAAFPFVAVLGGAGPASAAEPVSPADAALGWLATELAAHDGLLTVTFGSDSYPDQGLTIDAILAEVAGGHADDPAVVDAVAAVDATLEAYVTQSSAIADDFAANATAKSLLLQEVLGEDLGGALDVEAALRSLMATDGDEVGRFNDADEQGYGNYANGIGQALAVTALDRTAGGAPQDAIDFLLSQQCADGSFRLYYFGYVTSFDPFETVSDLTCVDVADGDVDATAFALDALLAVPASPAISTAIDDAVAFLLGAQTASGGFEGTGTVNVNTTGLAAAALRAAGETSDADAAAAFVASLQALTCADLGAVAYDQPAFAAGIDADRDQWIRATAQGALALGLPSYSAIGSAAPVPAGLEPVACATTAPGPTATATASAAGVTAGGSITITAAGFDPAETVDATLHSVPVALGRVTAAADGTLVHTYAIPVDIEPGQHSIELVGSTSGVTVSVAFEVLAAPSAAPTLPVTGGGSGSAAVVGFGLLGLGGALIAAGRRRLTRSLTASPFRAS